MDIESLRGPRKEERKRQHYADRSPDDLYRLAARPRHDREHPPAVMTPYRLMWNIEDLCFVFQLHLTC